MPKMGAGGRVTIQESDMFTTRSEISLTTKPSQADAAPDRTSQHHYEALTVGVLW